MGRGLITAVQTSSDGVLNYPWLIGKKRMDVGSVVEVESVTLVSLFNITVDLRE